MRIVIAAGIYPPEVGGPAPYAKGVKESLERAGHEATAILFRDFRHYPAGVRHFFYTLALWRAARGASAIFAFDMLSVGVPAVVAGWLRRVPVVIRVGGDYVWERYMQRTQELIPLDEFYTNGPRISMKERILKQLMGFALRHATLAFNTHWLLDILRKAYGFPAARMHVVENVIGERLSSTGNNGTLLMAGREVKLARAGVFRRAVKVVQAHGMSLSLVEGTFSREEFIERLRGAHAFINPDIGDFAPNAIIESIRCGKPFLLTKYCGYAERFADLGIVVDARDQVDVCRGIEALADPDVYATLSKRIADFKDVRTYDDVARELLALVRV